MPFLFSICGLAVLMMLSSFCTLYLYETVRQKWREGNTPPADFQITLHDANGIAFRQDKVTARGVAKLITHMNEGWYR